MECEYFINELIGRIGPNTCQPGLKKKKETWRARNKTKVDASNISRMWESNPRAQSNSLKTAAREKNERRPRRSLGLFMFRAQG